MIKFRKDMSAVNDVVEMLRVSPYNIRQNPREQGRPIWNKQNLSTAASF